jgi:hypothetical protein
MSPESSASTSVFSKFTLPDVGSINRRMQRPTVVLPDPDSPTSPSVSPFDTPKLMPSTAFTFATTRARMPRLTGKYLRRSRTTSSVSPAPTGTFGVCCGADSSRLSCVGFASRSICRAV